ncbi:MULTISPECIES: IS1 family transposase [Xenorhabdus]
MATVEVKCRFCQQTEFVKKYGKADAGHQHSAHREKFHATYRT